MKVAVVTPYDLGIPGGVQDQALRLTRWLETSGHEAVLIGPGTDGPEGAVLLGSTARIPANGASTPIAIDPRVIGKLRSAVAGADVVHVHEPLMPIVSTAAIAFGGVPKVGTFHADPPSWARFGYRIGSIVFKRAIRGIDVVTTVSRVSQSAVAPFAEARIIPNGIDVSEYGNETKVANRVAFLGRDDERKGLKVLLDAWPSVAERVPNAELHVIGAQRDEKIAGVTFLGRVDASTKLMELGQAEVFCAPNLGGESFGIVVAEGMASRCAVIASAIPAFVAVLGSAGSLTAPGDPDALADRIVELLTDREKLEVLQEAAATAVKQFDGPLVAALYVRAYEDAIARHRS